MPLRLKHWVCAQKGFERQLFRSPGIACSVASNVSQSGDYSTLSAAPAFTRRIWRHAWIRVSGAATNETLQNVGDHSPFCFAHFDSSVRCA